MPPDFHLSPEILSGTDSEFRKKLKDRLIQEFSIPKNTDKWLEEGGSLLSPRTEFATHLRYRLMQSPILAPKTRKIPRFWRRFLPQPPPSSFVRRIISVTTALSLFVSAFFFGLSGTSQASSKSFIAAFTGTIKINHGHGEDIAVSGNDTPIFSGTIISTEEHSFATLEFFEDSVLRMDEDTTVSIFRLDENPLRNDLGNVEVELLSGRVWIKTFAADDKYSRFLLKTSGEIAPLAGSAIDVERKGAKTIVRSWSRSARISVDMSEMVLAEGREAGILLGNISDPAPLLEEESSASWVLANKTEDEHLLSVFAQQKMLERQQEMKKEREEIQKQFFLMGKEEASDDILQLESVFFKGLDHISAEDLNPKDAMNPFFIMAQEAWKKYPHETETLLASLEKTLQPILQNSPLFAAKEIIDTLQTSFAEQPEVVQETLRTRQLWEAKTLADSGNIVLAEAILEETSDTNIGIGISSPEVATEILDQRQEQMVAVGAMEKTDISRNILEETEDTLVEKTTKLVRPHFPSGDQISEAEQARDIVLRMKKYSNERGQENTLRAHLRYIEDKPENIGLLQELRTRVPENLQNEVDEKIVSVLGGQQAP